MAVLSEPKRNAFVMKEDYADKIINSRMSKKEWDSIRANVALFKKNNKARGEVINNKKD